MATIIIRNSTGSGAVPSSLVQGELAINTVDGKLFYGSGSGNIVKEFTGSGGGGGSTFPYTGSADISGSLNINGPFTASNALISGNVTVLGTASISTLVVNQTQYSSGSNQLGDAANDTQTLYGSVIIPTGSLVVTGSTTSTGGFTGSLFGTASWAINALTASFINSASTNAFVQGGNSFGTQALLGTNDNQNLAFETSGSIRMFISSSGDTMIGTNLGTYGKLWVQSDTASTNDYTLVLNNRNTAGTGGESTGIYFANGAGGASQPYNIGHLVGSIKALATNWNNTTSRGVMTFNLNNSSIVQEEVMRLVNTTKNVLIGTTTDSGARLQIRGSGATSATTSFLVQNSTPTNIFTILDNSTVGINRTPTASLDVAGTTRLSGSFNTAASGSILTVIGSGSTQPIFTVQGSQGELFSVTDSLSGSLFSVNDISGLPILEVFSDNTTLIGDYQDPMLITTKKVTMTNSGSFVVYSLPTASYDTAFFDYSIKSGSNARAGQIMAIQSGSSVNFTETTTTDFGSTTAVSFTVIVSGSNMVLTGSAATGSWTIKTIIRGL